MNDFFFQVKLYMRLCHNINVFVYVIKQSYQHNTLQRRIVNVYYERCVYAHTHTHNRDAAREYEYSM